MKATLRTLARRAARLPLLGRLVRVAVAVARGPVMLDRLDSLERRMEPFQEERAGGRQQWDIFFDQQLPQMLRTLSEVHHAQHRIDSDQENLKKSVPRALRILTREGVQKAEQLEQLHEQVNEAAKAQDLSVLRESVGYLLGRVEFVRREVMFELRYGASSKHVGDSKTSTDIQVLSQEKMEAARREGFRINIGCGDLPISGYLNVDRRALPGVDIVAEVDQLPFDTGELQEVFSSHLLEHFPQEQLRRSLLPYFFRLLAPSGQLHAVVPDAEAMLKQYGEGHYPYDDLREVLYGGQDYDGDFHFNMFTPASLAALLEEAGFVDVRILDRGRKNGRCYEFEIAGIKPPEGVPA